jgi:hypothetical protein
MKQMVVKSVVLALIFGVATSKSALAYVDPSVGGMLFQVLAAGFAVLSGVALLFSRQIRVALARARRSLRHALASSSESDAQAEAHSQAADNQE